MVQQNFTKVKERYCLWINKEFWRSIKIDEYKNRIEKVKNEAFSKDEALQKLAQRVINFRDTNETKKFNNYSIVSSERENIFLWDFR